MVPKSGNKKEAKTKNKMETLGVAGNIWKERERERENRVLHSMGWSLNHRQRLPLKKWEIEEGAHKVVRKMYKPGKHGIQLAVAFQCLTETRDRNEVQWKDQRNHFNSIWYHVLFLRRYILKYKKYCIWWHTQQIIFRPYMQCWDIW